MNLQAVIVPPKSIVEHALTAAQTVYLKPEAPAARPGVIERVFQRQTRVAASTADLSVVASDAMFIRLAKLGSVTPSDARSLALALDDLATTWCAPVVHVAELDIELSDTQLMINAHLGGDIAGLRELFDNFNKAAKAQRFFLDRRSFRPEFAVASVPLPDDPTFLERLEWEADSHRGPDWQVKGISLMGVVFGDKAQTFEEVDLIALGGDATSGAHFNLG